MSTRRPLAAAMAAALLVALPLHSYGQDTEKWTTPEAVDAVLARMGDIQAAAEAMDPEKVFSFVLENDDGALVQDGDLLLTRAQALESTLRAFEGLQAVEYHFDHQHVTLLSPTVALAIGDGSSTATLNDGRVISTHFAQSVVLLLTENGWMVFHSHRSFPRPR